MGRLASVVGGVVALVVAGRAAAQEIPPQLIELASGTGTEAGTLGNVKPGVAVVSEGSDVYVVTVYTSDEVPLASGPDQCRCTSVRLARTGEPELVADRLVSAEVGGDHNCRHPIVAADGDRVVWLFTSDSVSPGDDNPHAGVLGPRCEQIHAPVRLYDGLDSNGVQAVARHAPGRFSFAFLMRSAPGAIAVGTLRLEIDGLHVDGIAPGVITPANLGRAALAAWSEDVAVLCAATGASRPPEIGVTCATLDAATRTVLWSEVVRPSAPDDRFVNQPSLSRAGDALLLMTIESDGSRRMSPTGGDGNRAVLQTLRVSPAGGIVLGAPRVGVGVHQRHTALCQGANAGEGRAAVFDAPLGDAGPALLEVVSLEPSAGLATLASLRVSPHATYGGGRGDAGTGGHASGRGFLACAGDVPNPAFGIGGGFLPNVRRFWAVPHSVDLPYREKLAMVLSLVPDVVDDPPPDTTSTSSSSSSASSSMTTSGEGGGAPGGVEVWQSCGCRLGTPGARGWVICAVALALTSARRRAPADRSRRPPGDRPRCAARRR